MSLRASLQSQILQTLAPALEQAADLWPAAVRARPYQAHGACARLIENRDPEVIISGPAETGKTVAGLHKVNAAAWEYPGMQGAIIRRWQRTMAGTVLLTYEQKVLAKGTPVRTFGGRHPERYVYPNGSTIWIGGMDYPEKVLSAERDLIYVNQAEEISLTQWEYLMTRTTGRAGNMPWTQLMGDCNPSAPSHWIRQRQSQKLVTLIESTHKDNPTLYDPDTGRITAQGRKTLGRLDRLTGTRKMRLRHGIWAQAEGAIYELFDEVRHKVKAFVPPAIWPRVVGIDPFGAQISAVFLAFDPGDGVLHVYREYLEPFGRTTPGHVSELLKLAKGETIFAWIGGAPSERQARTDWGGAGIPLLAPPVGDLWVGIDRVNQFLDERRILIHDSCPNLLSEIGTYRRKMKDGTPTEAIEDKEIYHLLDGLRYAIVWLTEPTEETRVLYMPATIGPPY